MTTADQETSRSSRKRMGAHYTPPLLARLVADRIVGRIDAARSGPIRLLDPTCGSGELLLAGIDAMLRVGLKDWEVVGVEADPEALGHATERLQAGEHGSVRLVAGDFLDLASAFHPQGQLWSAQPGGSSLGGQFDAVIANPPYVRTQVLGAARAQRLATQFGLSGRVDLYHAFVRAIGDTVRKGGVLGIITSNRFMTTLAGKAVRRFFVDHFEVLEVIDLGDTRLFEAAVLPAVVIARRRAYTNQCRSYTVPFVKVYSQPGVSADEEHSPHVGSSIVETIEKGVDGLVQVPEGRFSITRGRFSVARGTDGLWGLASSEESRFLKLIRGRSERTVGEAAFVRVGIKTTADEVFIRDDWAGLPATLHPEDALLRPLVCHEDVRPWAVPSGFVPARQVLYPHQVIRGRKVAVDLDNYPRSRAYLEQFRSRLERRRYVIDAGRRWYEVWVPQDPGAWGLPKLVFPDISPEPRFCVVDQDFVVNGDCYWLTLRPGFSEEMLYLILAVANSTLMARFHDAAFGNRLYAGRRRYITQYVGKYPLPPEDTRAARRVVSLAKQMVRQMQRGASSDSCRPMECALNALVNEAYGIETDEAPQ